VLDLLLFDDANPRSLSFQFGMLTTHSEKLPDIGDTAGHAYVHEDRDHLQTLQNNLQRVDLETVALDSKRNALKALMTAELQLMLKWSAAITERYFNATAEAPRRVHGRGEMPDPSPKPQAVP
jgi:uncharacterized alpha-E superfamily protein